MNRCGRRICQTEFYRANQGRERTTLARLPNGGSVSEPYTPPSKSLLSGKVMEQNKLFQAVSRVNSVLFLLLMSGGVVLFLVIIFQTSDWQDRRTVEVNEDVNAVDEKKIELRLGTIQQVYGHDVQYVELHSRENSGKFSSGYGSTETRNVLFFVGEDMKSHWLYDSHRNVVNSISSLTKPGNYNDKEPAIALYVSVTRADSNGDGRLTNDDDITLALLRTDGDEYTEIETGIWEVLDREVTEDGKYLILLLQVGSNVLLKKYSLETFGKVSERVVTEISKKM